MGAASALAAELLQAIHVRPYQLNNVVVILIHKKCPSHQMIWANSVIINDKLAYVGKATLDSLVFLFNEFIAVFKFRRIYLNCRHLFNWTRIAIPAYCKMPDPAALSP